MTNPEPLVEYHIRTHAEELGSILSDYSVDDIYALTTTLPPATGAKLTALLDAVKRATLLDKLEDPDLMELLVNASSSDFYAITVLLDQNRTTRLLQASEGKQHARLKDLFENRENTVSGRMTSNFLAFSVMGSIDNAISRITRSRPLGIKPIYAVDDTGRLLGEIDPFLLIQQRGSRKNLEALVRETAYLQTNNHLQSAMNAELWTGRRFLPVVDHADRLVGTLSLGNLREDQAMVDTSPQLHPLLATEFIRLLGSMAVAIFGSQQK